MRGQPDAPWGVYVVDGLLRLEEYAFTNSVKGDRTYNGHTFSAYGLYDYWDKYHDIHIRQLGKLHAITGDPEFARRAGIARADLATQPLP